MVGSQSVFLGRLTTYLVKQVLQKRMRKLDLLGLSLLMSWIIWKVLDE